MIHSETMFSKKLHSIIEDISKEKIQQSKSIILQVQDIAVHCTQISPDKVVLSTSLGEISKIQRDLTEVLRKNLGWSASREEVLSALDSELILFKNLDLKGVNRDNFEEELYSISSSMEFWREYLANEEIAGGSNPTPEGSLKI